MKKLLYCAAALATVFFAASCQRENLEPVVEGKTVTLTVEAPGAVQTRAIADGMTVDTLVYEVWINGQTTERLYQDKVAMEHANGMNTAKVSVELLQDQEYTVLFWAHKSGIYNTNDLTNVTYAATANENGELYAANNEELDAFYACKTLNSESGDKVTVTLRRPFAQLNLGTLNKADKYNIELDKSKITVVGAANAFNVMSGEASGVTTLEFSMNNVPGDSLYVNSKGYLYAGMNYLFETENNVKVTYDIETLLNGNVSASVNNTVENVPLKENYRTNIVGNLLTSKTDYEIVVDADFADKDLDGGKYGFIDGQKYVKVENYTEFASAFNDETVGMVILAADVTFGVDTRAASDITMKVASGKTLVLDLNGKKLSATSAQTGKNYNMFEVRGTLTVKNGTIEYEHKGENMGWNASTNLFDVTAGGVLNLEGVTAKNLGGSDMGFVAHLNNWGEVTLNVDNCTLESNYIAVRVYNSGSDVNNVDIKNSTLKGKYCFWVHNYKGAGDSVGDDSTLNLDIFDANNTFENTGKAPVLFGFANPIYYDASGDLYVGQSELNTLSQTEGATITVSAGEYTLPASIANDVTIVGKEGTVLTASEGISGQNLTFKNVTLTGSTSFAAGTSAVLENCVINRINAQEKNSLDLQFKNCNIGGSVAVQMDLLEGGKASFEGCEISGWNAFGGTGELTVKDCKFTYSFDYNQLRIYNLDKADFENCEFDPNYSIDIKGINGTKNVDVKFNNCKVVTAARSTVQTKRFIELLDLSKLSTYKTASYVIDGTRVNYTTKMIKTADELCAITDIKAGDVIILVADIDLAGKDFNGLDTFHPENNTLFDGMGFTVSNWTNESGASDMGFIRNWVGPVKNLTIANANLKTSGRSAIVAAKIYGNITNCHVVNSTIVDSYWACGLIAGLYNAGSIYNCTVTGSSVESNGGTAAIVGVINESAGTRGLYNCSVSNTTVNNTGAYGEVYSGALLCGMINISNSTVEFEGCTYENNTKEGKYVGDLYYSADDDIKVVLK